MTKKLLLGTIAGLALASACFPTSTAQAANVGDIVQFVLPRVACQDFDDAGAALNMGESAAEQFARTRKDYIGGHACAVLGGNDEYKVVDKRKTQWTGPSDSYVCVKPTVMFDVGSPVPNYKPPAAPPPCYWVFLRGSDQAPIPFPKSFPPPQRPNSGGWEE